MYARNAKQNLVNLVVTEKINQEVIMLEWNSLKKKKKKDFFIN